MTFNDVAVVEEASRTDCQVTSFREGVAEGETDARQHRRCHEGLG